MNEPISILDNKKTTYTFTYTVNGTKVRETLSLDLMNGNFGTTISMKEDMGWGNGFRDISPNSELGKAIANGDDNGARQNEYLNAMDRISTLVDKQSLSNSTTLENALLESGMYETANGTVPLDKTVVESTNIIDGGVVSEDDSEIESSYDSAVADEELGYTGKIPDPPKILIFPANAAYNSNVGPSQDYMKIDMFKYKAPQEGFLNPKGTAEQKEQNFANTITQGLQVDTPRITEDGGYSGSRIKEYLGTTKLPIPNQLGASNGVEWGTASANAFEAAAFMTGFNSLQSLAKGKTDLLKLGSESLGGIKGAIETLGSGQGSDAVELLSAQATKMALQSLNINTDTRQFITRSSGKAINPNLETLFSAPKIRSFNFQFEFLPQNIDDARSIRRIMRFFKQGMLPARGSSGESSGDLFLLSPNVFRISYMNGVNRIRSLNTFKMCALTGCNINYTPGGTWSAYDDPDALSQPTASTMDLSFSELTPIFADDYDLTMKNRERLRDQIEEHGPLKEWFNEEDIGF